MQEFQISQVTYVQKIRQSKFSTIFLVKVRCGGSTSQKSEEEEGKGKGKEKDKEKEKEKTCVMKVYRNQRLPGVNPQREYSLFLCESRAYRRLEEKGLCKRGVVPQFYGVIRNMKPSSWADHLHMFCGDELLPNAVLLEYIPNMQMMDVPYFKSELLDKLERILKDIHVAGVLHDDPYPRNMMVVPGTSGTPDRVLWIDFDRAQTYPVSHTAQTETYPAPPLERQQTLFQSEAKMMRQFVEAAKQDHTEYPGKYKKTYAYYFDGHTPDEGGAFKRKSPQNCLVDGHRVDADAPSTTTIRVSHNQSAAKR